MSDEKRTGEASLVPEIVDLLRVMIKRDDERHEVLVGALRVTSEALVGVRQEMKAELVELRQELKAELVGMRQELKAGFDTTNRRLKTVEAEVRGMREEMREPRELAARVELLEKAVFKKTGS